MSYTFISSKKMISQIFHKHCTIQWGKEPIFVMELNLSPDKPLAREDVIKVIKNLESLGYHVQMPPQTNNLMNFKEPANYVS